MENHISVQNIKESLHKVCSVQSFAKSPRYTRVLTYLVEQAIDGNDLKEQTIGIELFEEKYNSDKNDGIVRVYMYNLRKKLKAYYLDTGKNDAVLFLLEKGSYNLKFIANDASASLKDNSKEEYFQKNRSKVSYFLIAFCILGGLSYFLIPTKKMYCWESFFEKNAVNTCVLADQVIMYKKGSDIGDLMIRKGVNSPSDYINYTQKNRGDSLLLSDYTFFTKAIPYSVNKLSSFFTTHHQVISLVPESEFRYDELNNNNIIYIGQYKTMNVSREIFLKKSKVFKANHNHFVYTLNGKETIFKAKFEDGLRSEYVMVSYMTLRNGNKAIYFVSNHDIGTMGSIYKFTDLKYLKEFYEKLPLSEVSFNALFKVEGIDRSDINCELVQLEIIKE